MWITNFRTLGLKHPMHNCLHRDDVASISSTGGRTLARLWTEKAQTPQTESSERFGGHDSPPAQAKAKDNETPQDTSCPGLLILASGVFYLRNELKFKTMYCQTAQKSPLTITSSFGIPVTASTPPSCLQPVTFYGCPLLAYSTALHLGKVKCWYWTWKRNSSVWWE